MLTPTYTRPNAGSRPPLRTRGLAPGRLETVKPVCETDIRVILTALSLRRSKNSQMSHLIKSASRETGEVFLSLPFYEDSFYLLKVFIQTSDGESNIEVTLRSTLLRFAKQGGALFNDGSQGIQKFSSIVLLVQ